MSGAEGEHSLIRVVDLKHGVGDELQELLHLERGRSFVRLRELGLHWGIGVGGGGRELGCHERGRSDSKLARLLHQLCEMHIKGTQTSLASFILII